MPRNVDEIKAELDAIALETAQVNLERSRLELEQTKETVAQWKGDREQRQRTNKQRQTQLRNDREEVARIARVCTHRQGGSPKNPYGGKGQAALSVAQMPDGHTQLVTCAICRLRVFSPNDRDMAKNSRPGESRDDAKRRVEKYLQARAEFDRLLELSQDKLTPEAAAPMHCGVTFTYMNGDGQEVLLPRPCDAYAQGLDNRAGARA